MALDFKKQRSQLQVTFPLPDLETTIQNLKEQELTLPAPNQGVRRVGINLAVEEAPLKDYLSLLTVADASIMFTLPPVTDKQGLTWFQVQPLSELQSLWANHLDMVSRWGAQLRGNLSQVLAELFASAGVLIWQGGPVADYLATGQPGKLGSSLARFAYIDQLAQTYSQAGIPVSREVCGLYTSTLVPPSLLVALIALEAQLISDNGATDIVVAYTPCGNILQDVAAIGVLADLTRHLKARVVCLSWTGGSLLGVQNASTVAAWTALTAGCAGVRHLEAAAVDKDSPLKPEQVVSLLELAGGVFTLAADQAAAIAQAANQEQQFILLEAQSIVDRVLELGQGKVATGLELALTEGSLDVPLAGAGLCQGQVLSARDATGAVRFLDSGALPLPSESKEWNRERLAQRADTEGRQPNVAMVIDDIYAFSKGALVGRK